MDRKPDPNATPESPVPAPDRDSNPIPDTPGDLLSTFRRGLGQPENLTLLVTIGIAVGVVWVLIEVVERAESFRRLVTEILRLGISGEVPESAQATPGLSFLAFLLLLCPVAFGLYSVRAYFQSRLFRNQRDDLSSRHKQLTQEQARVLAERNQLDGENRQLTQERDSLRGALDTERDRVQKTLEARTLRLQRTVEGGIKAAVRIRDQLFPVEERSARKSFESVEFTYYINKNFDAEVRRRYRIRAGEAPLHFWQNSIRVSNEADPIETFADLDFRLIGHDRGKDVVYLPTRNEPHDKAACIFFLPRIEPDTCRDIEIAYRWPRMNRQLLMQGWEEFSVKLNSAHQLRLYSIEIYLEPGTGGALHCEEAGVLLPHRTLESVTSYQGWPGWRYSSENIDVEWLDRRIALRVEWRKS